MSHKENKLQEKIIALLKEKAPHNLANTLREILPLEKEAIYRRLRGDVPFSFAEMAILSSYFGISLDYIANIISPFRSREYQLHIRDYSEFKPIDLNMSYNYIEAIHMAAESPHSEFGIAANMLPLHISLLHPPLYRVYLLKWKYQFGNTPKNELSYASTQVPIKERETYQPYLDAVKKISHTFFIWDNSFFISLIHDINFFHSISFINREEMIMLKQEMVAMLDTIKKYADHGKFEDTGNTIEIYVSNLNFETSYSYLSGNNISLSMSSVYTLGAFSSLEGEACKEMKKWIMGLKKSSTLISGVAEREKILFFKRQREILDKKFTIKENEK